MSFPSIYISTPGTLHTNTDPTTVYLLSSINPLSQEIIIRDTGLLTGGKQFVVSTTQGLRFSPSLSTQTLSSFTATTPYSFITVAPRTPTEYILLEAPGFTNPNRTNRLDLAPNYLYLSTLSTLSLTASTRASLGDFTIGVGSGNPPGGANITTYPNALTTLAASTITAPFISAATLQVSSVQALAITTSTLNTITPIVQTSAYVGATSTLAGTTTAAATFQGDLTQTDGLGLGLAALITVAGTAAFQSTLQTTTAQLYNQPAGFGSTFTVAGTTTATATFSTLGSLYVAGDTRTDSNYNVNTLSTISYNALATAHPVKAFFGTSNTNPYTAFVQGNAATTGPFITPATSSLTLSTATASFSSITFLEGATRYRIAGSNGAILVNETAITSSSYAPFFSTVLASNYVDVRGEFRTSTLQVNMANPTPYNASSLQYTLEARGNMYVSSAFVMDNMAVYGGTNPTLYTTPAFNTLYASTNGLLINNRLFVNGIQNRVGVNNANPAYTLDISAQLFVNATNVFNIGTTSWVVASDSALKENIQDVSGAALDSYSAVVEALPLKRYRYKQDRTYNVDISRSVVDAQGFPVLDGQGNPVLENATVQQTDIGFASEYQLGSAQRYGFIAQDVELFFPNAVYETPFYKYADFNFLTTGPIFNAQYTITRTMVSTVVGHSTIVGRRREFISTVSQRQKNILGDLSGSVGYPYSAITIGFDGQWSFIGSQQPTAPSGFSIIHKDLGFDLSWIATGEENVNYIVYYKNITSGSASYISIDRGTNTTASITGLTDLSTYEFYVVAKNTVNNLISTYTPTQEIAYSWPKDVLVSVTPGNNSLTLGFSGNKTGGTFIKYKIYDAAGTTLIYEHPFETPYTFTGLDFNTSYSYSVSLVTKEGPPTDEVIQESAKFTTIATSPYTIPLVSATVEGLDRQLRFTITGTARGGSITKYRIYNSLGTTLITESPTNIITISSLTNGTTYTYRVTVVSTIGLIEVESSQYSISGKPGLPPSYTSGVPVIFSSTTDFTNGKMVLSRVSAFSPGSGTITSYIFELYNVITNELLETINSNINLQTVGPYPINKDYYFKLYAESSYGKSTTFARSVNFSLKNREPLNFAASITSPSTGYNITFSWTRNTGNTFSSYNFYYSTNGINFTLVNLLGTTTSRTFTNIAAGVYYHAYVVGVNSDSTLSFETAKTAQGKPYYAPD
jgi:hypothetical protein